VAVATLAPFGEDAATITCARMYDSIVVGTDGSDTAELAVSKAADIAARLGARLHVVSAYQPANAHIGGQKVREQGDWAIGPDYKVDAVLSKVRDQLADSGVEPELHARREKPADAILALADEVSADLIVIGSRGMQGPRRMLGSVPNDVSHHAACDVMIVKTS
jgi:nucleotide-binding universal stress UspA family protein